MGDTKELSIEVKAVKEIWKSPDGQRTIYEVTVESEGKLLAVKTFSNTIATVGWHGTVVAEKRPGRNGEEVFIKQTPKEGGFGRQPKDEKAISAMWAIGQANIYHEGKDVSPETIEDTAKDFFLMIARVKAAVPSDRPEHPDQLYDTDGPIDLSKVDDIFNQD